MQVVWEERSAVSMAELSGMLWRERELLELLTFKLEEEQLILSSGRHRWLARATREVELVLERVGESEMVRASIVDEVAAELGLPPGASLRRLADRVEEPWKGLLHEHRNAFLQMTGEIQALTESNRELLLSAKAVGDKVLATVGAPAGGFDDGVTTYEPSGARVSEQRRSLILDGDI